MADEKLIVEVDLEKGDTSGAFEEIEREASESGEKSGKSFSDGFLDSTKSLMGKVAKITAVAGSVISALAAKESITAANAQEIAVQSLNTSLALAGTFSREASRDIQKFASDLQEVTTVGDETTLAMFGLARNITRTNEQAKELTGAAVQLSAATGLSLESSVKNLGKTFSGLTGELGESLPAVKDFTIEQLKAGKAIEFVLSRFGGAAEGKVNSFSGAIKQLTNAFGDSLEQQGFIITKSPTLIKTIQTLTKWFADSAKSTKKFADEIGDIFLPIANFLIKIAGAINKHLLRPMEFAFGRLKELFIESFGSFSNFLNIVTNTFSRVTAFTASAFQTMTEASIGFAIGTIQALSSALEFIKPFVTTVVGFISRLFEMAGVSINGIVKTMISGLTSVIGLLRPILQKMGLDTDAILGKVKTSMESIVPDGSTLSEKFEALTGSFSTFKDGAVERLTGLKEFISSAIGGGISSPLADKFQARLDEYASFINSSKKLTDEFKNNTKAGFEGMSDSAKAMSKSLNSSINGAMMALVTQGMTRLGAQLMKGGAAWKDWEKAVLGIVGDLAIKLGQTLIAKGLAIEALGKALATLSGGAAIAAGFGLIALGGALKSMGAVSPSDVASGASPDTSSIDNTRESFVAADDIERSAPSTNVEVVVQGSIVAQQELGEMLVETISESFGKQGVSFTDFRSA